MACSRVKFNFIGPINLYKRNKNVYVEDLKRRDDLEYLDVDDGIILKFVFITAGNVIAIVAVMSFSRRSLLHGFLAQSM
jgi:hypothetical protein